jgi:hypothetical protein
MTHPKRVTNDALLALRPRTLRWLVLLSIIFFWSVFGFVIYHLGRWIMWR